MPSCPVGSGTPAGHSPPLQKEVFSAIAIAMFYPFPSACPHALLPRFSCHTTTSIVYRMYAIPATVAFSLHGPGLFPAD